MSTCLSTRESSRCVFLVRENRLTPSHRFALGSLEAASTAFEFLLQLASARASRPFAHAGCAPPAPAIQPTSILVYPCSTDLGEVAPRRTSFRPVRLHTGEGCPDPMRPKGTFRFHDGLPASAGPSSVPPGCSPVVLDEDLPLTSLSPSRVCRAALSRGHRSTSCRPSSSSPFGRENRPAGDEPRRLPSQGVTSHPEGFRLRDVSAGASKSNHPRTNHRDRARRPALASSTDHGFPCAVDAEVLEFALHDSVPVRTLLVRQLPLSRVSFDPSCDVLRGENWRGER